MKKVIVVGMVALLGCEQTQIVGSCESANDATRLAASPDGGDGGEGFGGSGGSGGVGNLAGGAPCDNDTQCASLYCVASKNDWTFGYCYGPEMDGCLVVTDPSPHKSSCAALSKVLYVCGDGYDVAQLGTCTLTSSGTLNEAYHCCNKP